MVHVDVHPKVESPSAAEPQRDNGPAPRQSRVVRAGKRVVDAVLTHGDSQLFGTVAAFAARHAWLVIGCYWEC